MNTKALVNILIVEDEPILALATKKMLLKMGYLKVEVAHKQSSAISILLNDKVDLAILDINLGNGEEGIELAKMCLELNIQFFYISSYSDTATLDKALKTNPGAYIIKPFLTVNLYSAIALTIGTNEQLEEHAITIKQKGTLVKLKLNDILYLKADDVYVEIHTATKCYTHRVSIVKFIEEFGTNQLVKANRTYAVNLKYIDKINATSVSIGNIEIPITRTYKQKLLQHFKA